MYLSKYFLLENIIILIKWSQFYMSVLLVKLWKYVFRHIFKTFNSEELATYFAKKAVFGCIYKSAGMYYKAHLIPQNIW